MSPLVEMSSISKAFGPTVVLRNVDFSVEGGSIHALMGENGAGKSTLMRILSGVFHPTSGSVRVRGETVKIETPKQATLLGISTIYQEFMLIPNLTVAENMFLGHEPRRPDGSVDRKVMMQRAVALLGDVFPGLDAGAIVATLSVAQQQAVEIAKGLTTNADIFVFDEPTAALNSSDVEHLFRVIRDLKAAGKAIVYISHRLHEIFELADTITVMKDGARVKTAPTKDFTVATLVSTMVGRELTQLFPSRPEELGTPSLKVSDLRLAGGTSDLSLELRRGEIVGLAGLEGQGQREIMRSIVGILPAASAKIERQAADGSVQQVDVARGFGRTLDAKIGFIPEDRKLEGLFLTLSVNENIALGKRVNRPFLSRTWRSPSRVRDIISSLKVAVANPSAPVGRLSGGNQQKVLLGRSLLSGVEVLVIEEPTRGVDVGSKAEIYRLLRDFTAQGGAVLVASRELAELIGLCDRIVVVHDKQVVGALRAENATEEKILSLALNVADEPTHAAVN